MSRQNYCEKIFNEFADIVNSYGGHAHKNNALRTSKGINIADRGEAWDFEFFGRKHLYCFDTKEFSADSFYLSTFLAQPSNFGQFKRLINVQKLGKFYVCGFVVHFSGFAKIRFFDISLFQEPRKKSLNHCDGIKFNFQEVFNDCVSSTHNINDLLPKP